MDEKAASKNRSVTLFVPGFAHFNPADIRKMIAQPPSLDALQLLRARADVQYASRKSALHTLFEVFDVPQDPLLDFPVGALTHFLAKGKDAAGKWMMRADPVLIQPNRDHLLLVGNAGLDISMDDAQLIVTDINQAYHDTGWNLEAITPKQWVIQHKTPQQLKSHSLSEVTGKNINDYLPTGEHEKDWHALMNELQMFLHGHPLNQNRQMQGKSFFNSLWFWGAGRLPEVAAADKPFAQCWSDETISLGLARLLGVPRADLPSNGEQWLKQAITPGKHFLMLELLDTEIVKNDPVEWWQSLVTFNNQWLAPFVEAVKHNAIASLDVIDSAGSCYHFTKSLSRRWWKLINRI